MKKIIIDADTEEILTKKPFEKIEEVEDIIRENFGKYLKIYKLQFKGAFATVEVKE